jgi:vacuolar-type H+-ATPase subunit E/Vma4
MAIAELIAELERQGESEAERVIAHARADAERRITEARARADQREAAWREPEAKRLEEATRRVLADARRAANQEVLRARQQLLDRVLEMARRRLNSVGDEPAFRTALPALVREALVYLERDEVVIRCAPALVEWVTPLIEGRAGASVVGDSAVGPGVVVESRDGKVTVDNTMGARLDRLAPILALDIVRRMEEVADTAVGGAHA